MNTRVFKITAKTNLHVGNESDNDFTIIDKTIQRDSLTSLPCINSSSLKGAIKEYCYHLKKQKTISIDMMGIFGSDIDENGKTSNSNQKGSAIFFDAKLLYIPQQDNDNYYHYVTSDKVISMMNERIKLFVPNFSYKSEKEINKHSVTCLEKDEDLISCCNNENLPIIARNVLENGESKNLWYEQVLPSETILYTIIVEEGDDLMNALNGKIVQIGADATIGYGYCLFELLYPITSSSDINNNTSYTTSSNSEEPKTNNINPKGTTSSKNSNFYQNQQQQHSNNKSKNKKKGRR